MLQLRWIGFVALHSSIAQHMSFVPEIFGVFIEGRKICQPVHQDYYKLHVYAVGMYASQQPSLHIPSYSTEF
jgi:hypothetical protein